MTRVKFQIRIGHLAVDAAALGGSSRPQFAELLQHELAGRLAGSAKEWRDPLIDRIADGVVARIAETPSIPRIARTDSQQGAKR